LALSEATKKEIDAALRRYPERRTAVLDALRAAQREKGYLGSETILEVAEIVGLDANALHSLMTFYDLFYDQPVGQHVVMICRGISCYLRGADDLIQYLTERLGVPTGGTTADGQITIRTMECLASCTGAPAMILASRQTEQPADGGEPSFHVNERYIENLTREKLDQILSDLAAAVPAAG